MRKIIFLVGLSSLSFASPKIGEFVVYEEIKSGTVNGKGELRIDLIDFDNQKGFLERTTETLDGNTTTSEVWKGLDQYSSDVEIQDVMKTCESIGGEREDVDVPAGTFNACGLSMSDEGVDTLMFAADVPITRFVEVDIYDHNKDQHTYLYLKDYSK